jgi:membrane protein
VMVGLYFSWLILLFGAQVAYNWQNRRAYIQDKQAENINQRGREFIALRLMQCVGQRFLRGERAATVPEMAEALVVPSRLVQQIMQTLLTAGLLVEVAGQETAYSPARPLEAINCHHILLALRAGQGEELATRDDPARAEVFGEFEKILEAERKASSGVTVLAMVNRTEVLAALTARPAGVLPEGKHEPPVAS